MTGPDAIAQTVLRRYPDVPAIYLFGSYGTDNEWPDSDVDIALLLPPKQASAGRPLAMSPLCAELGSLLKNPRKPILTNRATTGETHEKERDPRSNRDGRLH